jgi:hypothetical protein
MVFFKHVLKDLYSSKIKLVPLQQPDLKAFEECLPNGLKKVVKFFPIF